MDLKKYRQKLIGSEQERAVSPVIGVILMVTITVILAAVIAAFVLDMGDDMGNSGSMDAAVSSDVSNSDQYVQLEVTKTSDVDKFVLRGDVDGSEVELTELNNTGDTMTISNSSPTATGEPVDSDGLGSANGTANIIAISGDSETNAGSFEWDW